MNNATFDVMKVSFLALFICSFFASGVSWAVDNGGTPSVVSLDTIQERYPDGRLLRLYTVQKNSDTREGRALTYHPNGRLAIDASYKNGRLEGSFKSYFDNGLPWQMVNYVNGVENGVSLHYFKNGKLMVRENYVMGELEGDHEEWYENGSQKYKMPYFHGQMHGVVKAYDEYGSLAREINYNRGLLHGSYRIFKNGMKVVDALFENNRCVRNCNF